MNPETEATSVREKKEMAEVEFIPIVSENLVYCIL